MRRAAVLAIALAAWAAASGDIVTLTQSTFDAYVDAADLVLVKFFSPQCPKCLKLAPEFERAAELLRGEIPLAEVDVLTSPQLGDRYHISNFPTMMVFRLGVPASYYGPSQSAGIAKYMREQSAPSAAPLRTAQELDDFVAAVRDDCSVVGFFRGAGSADEREFLRLAAVLRDDYHVGVVREPALVDARHAGREGIAVLCPYAGQEAGGDVSGADLAEKKRSVYVLSVPLAGVFKPQHAKRYEAVGLPRVVVWAAFGPEGDPSRTKWALNRMRKAAKGFEGKLVFALSDRRFDIDYENMRRDGDPEMVIGVVDARGVKYRAASPEKFSADASNDDCDPTPVQGKPVCCHVGDRRCLTMDDCDWVNWIEKLPEKRNCECIAPGRRGGSAKRWDSCQRSSECEPGLTTDNKRLCCHLGDRRCLTKDDCEWVNWIGHTSHPCTCITDSCFNGYLNFNEADVDCGRDCPGKCKEFQKCWSNSDCLSGVCGKSTAERRTASGATAALAVAVAALMIATVPVALLVAYAKPVLDNLAAPHVSLAAGVREGIVGTASLPSKWAAPYLLPQYFQEDRGTCWDFATIGVLEQSYRHNGVAKGFMSPDTYMRFSEQAYGISVVEECRHHPDVCDVLGDEVYHNSTEGGEVWWLYSLTKLYNQLLPVAVCPYSDDAHEHECPGMTQALATNPIKFDIKSMETAYNVLDTKALMVAKNRPLAWSSLMHNVVYYMPCSDEHWARQEGCNATNRVRCPTDRYYNSEWCARFVSAMYNQDGEFFIHGNTVPEGGHAMNVVGYNDEFVTKQGHKGGFIIKNSWHDLTYGSDPNGRGARGSHSVAYWMQQISAWDEKALCPGPLNPDNWLSCVSQTPGPTMRRGARKPRTVMTETGAAYDISETCLKPSFMDYLVNVTLQPVEFRCLDSQWCSQEQRYRYFLVSTERSVEMDLMQVCMLQHETATGAQKTLCTPYVNPSLIAYIWAPIESQVRRLRNDPDFCGYYFWPYELSYKQTGMYVNYYSTYFDIEWEDSSYLANAKRFPAYDYTLVKASTSTQKQVTFGSLPSPFPKQRY
eukprot:m51a1_g10863 putative cysteine protease domain containing protein (1058) ;mRNA; r:26430-31553